MKSNFNKYMGEEKRTLLQNNALHLYCEMVAEELRNKGLTMNDVVKMFKIIEIAPTKVNVKENIWKPIQVALFKKEHTAKLTKKEVNEVYDNVSRFLASMDITLPFPNEQDLMEKELDEKI